MGAIGADAYVIESFALRDTCSETEGHGAKFRFLVRRKIPLCQCYR
jgi:hypothetical protein